MASDATTPGPDAAILQAFAAIRAVMVEAAALVEEIEEEGLWHRLPQASALDSALEALEGFGD